MKPETTHDQNPPGFVNPSHFIFIRWQGSQWGVAVNSNSTGTMFIIIIIIIIIEIYMQQANVLLRQHGRHGLPGY